MTTHPLASRLRHPPVVAFAYFLLLTLAVTWPLALHWAERVPGWYVADNYEYLWKMWWFKHSLVDLKQSPLVAPDIFYPQGFNLAHAELTPLHTLLGLPLTWAFGEVVTYNTFAALSFVISGWATYLLVRGLTGREGPSLLAGTLFALVPYHTVRYGGILPLMSVEGIPVFFLGLQRWAATRHLRWGIVASAGFLLAAWASAYYGLGLALLGPLFLLVQLRGQPGLARDRSAWRLLAALLVAGAIGLLPLALPHWQLGRTNRLAIPLEEVDFWSASVTDYLLPPGLHPLWGSFVRQRLLSIPAEYPQIALEFVLGLGWLTLIFAALGARQASRSASRPYLWLTIFAAVLSFGPRLHLGRHALVIPTPDGLSAGFNQLMDWIGARLPARESYQALATDGITFPLPALLLRWLLPVLQGLRAWNRFAAFVSFGAAVLAGLGCAAWLEREVAPEGMGAQRARRRIQWAGAIVLALAVFELWPGLIPLQPIRPRPVDLWLAGQPGQFTIMELPLGSALSAPQMLYTRYHGKRTAFAYGTYFPIWYRQTYPELADCPAADCLGRLREWDVRYVLLNREAMEPGSGLEGRLNRAPELERVGPFGEVVVYRLLPEEGG
jgi:hypothetical protein